MPANSSYPFQEHCISLTNDPKVTLADSGKQILLHNTARHELSKITVDGCEVPRGTKELRCDYLVIVNQSGKHIFIEIKGSDLDRAYTQLLASTKKFLKEAKGAEWIIAYSGSPNIQTRVDIQKANATKLGIKLHVIRSGRPFEILP